MTSAPCRGSCSWGHFCCLRLAASSCTSRFCFKCRGSRGFQTEQTLRYAYSCIHIFQHNDSKSVLVCFSDYEPGPCILHVNALQLAVYEPRSMGFAANSSGQTARARQIAIHTHSRAENRRTCSRARSTPPPPHLTTRRAQAGAAACWMPRCSSFNIWRGIASALWPTWRRQASTSSAHALRRGCQSAQPRAARRWWV